MRWLALLLAVGCGSSSSGSDGDAPKGGPDSGDFAIKLSPTQEDFGTVACGVTSAAHVFTAQNISGAFSAVPAVELRGDFAVGSNGCHAALRAAGDSCQIEILFRPTHAGAATGLLTVHAGTQFTAASSLTGTGTRCTP